MRQRFLAVLFGAVALAAVPAAAQQTTGTINGRVLDDQGGDHPGRHRHGDQPGHRLHPFDRHRRRGQSIG